MDQGRAMYDTKSIKISTTAQEFQKIKVHLVFACKHNGHHKVRLVAGGPLTADPRDISYSGIVSTRPLRLSIFLAKLNNMKVWAVDLVYEYLEATTKEKLYVVAGAEFQELQGHILLFHKKYMDCRGQA